MLVHCRSHGSSVCTGGAANSWQREAVQCLLRQDHQSTYSHTRHHLTTWDNDKASPQYPLFSHCSLNDLSAPPSLSLSTAGVEYGADDVCPDSGSARGQRHLPPGLGRTNLLWSHRQHDQGFTVCSLYQQPLCLTDSLSLLYSFGNESITQDPSNLLPYAQ